MVAMVAGVNGRVRSGELTRRAWWNGRWFGSAGVLAAFVLLAGGLAGSARASGASPQLYWSTEFGGTIGAANLDGTNARPSLITGASTPGDIAVDGQYVYWANISGGIGRANLDGTGANQSFIPGNIPEGVAVSGQHVYWTNFGSNTIGEANLDGTNVNQSFITGVNNPRGIAVDDQYVYWANQGNGTIGRADLDGTNVNQSFITTGGNPYGVTVDSNYLYWTDFFSNSLGRATIGGGSVNSTFITGATGPFGVAVDSSNIFWSNRGNDTIGEANLDGSSVNESFITGAGSGPYGIAVLAPPGAPNGVSASSGDRQATVSFSAPASGSPISSYTVTASPGGATATGSASPITVSGLTDGTAYSFTVSATNAVGTGQASSPSNSVTPAGAPGAPSSVTATAGNGQATVSFSAPPSNGSAITAYTVTAAPGGTTATGSGGPITVSGLSNGTAYTFTVSASNGIGKGPASAPSNAVTPTAPAVSAPASPPTPVDTGPPTAPMGLTGDFSPTGLSLSWQPSTDNIGVSYYEIYRNGSPLERVPAPQTAATTRTIDPKGPNVYTVRAFDQAGNQSAVTNTITAARSTRPDILKRIPHWAWQLLAWQEGAQHAAKPTTPATVPGWYTHWKAWRLAPFHLAT